MPRQPALIFQHAFNKGELSPDLSARKDWQPVFHGAASAKNVIVKTTGAAIKAPGTKFIGTALEQGRPIRFIPFQFSDSQSYVLEFGNYKFRIIHNGGFVVYPEGHAQAGEIVVIQSPFSIEQMQSFDKEINIGVRNVDYCQENDTMIFVHAESIPKVLTRYDHHEWRWTDLGVTAEIATPQNVTITTDGGNDVSYCVSAMGNNPNGVSVESFPSRIVTTVDAEGDGNTTLTWDAVAGATTYRVYRQYENDSGFEWRMVGTTTSTTYSDTKGSTGNASIRPKPELNPFNQIGRFPSVCTFHGGRLVMGSPNEKPNRIYGSSLNDFRNFALPDIGEDPTDEDAYEWNINGGSTSPIFTALVSNTELIMMATSGEFRADGERPAISFGAKVQSHYGSSPIKPIMYRQTVIFVGKNRKALNSFSLSPLTGNYDATEISHFSSHIFTETKILSIADQPEPYKGLYAVLENGMCAIVTYMPDQDVLGVTRRETDGAFEEIESIDANGETAIYIQTRREINGKTVRYIEMMVPNFELGMNIDDAWYVDCGIDYQGDPKMTFEGLEHLEGKNVVINADGYGYGYQGDPITVKDGKITIPQEASKVIVGLGYESELKTIDLGPQNSDPSMMTRQPIRATVNFLNSRDCMVACEESKEQNLYKNFAPWHGEKMDPNKVQRVTFMVPADPRGSVSSSLTLRSRSPWPWGVARVDMVLDIAQTNNMRS